MLRTSRPLRVLCFDLEARPLGWYAGDQTHKEITVAAWCWQDGEPEAKALSKDRRTRVPMLKTLRHQYDQADIVYGHYIRAFDLPLLNAMLIEQNEPPLGQKLTHDTKIDLVPMHGISKSQENLSAMLGIPAPKIHLNTQEWRKANRLEDGDAAIQRAIGDVRQNMLMRAELIRRGLLRPPKVWRP